MSRQHWYAVLGILLLIAIPASIWATWHAALGRGQYEGYQAARADARARADADARARAENARQRLMQEADNIGIGRAEGERLADLSRRVVEEANRLDRWEPGAESARILTTGEVRGEPGAVAFLVRLAGGWTPKSCVFDGLGVCFVAWPDGTITYPDAGGVAYYWLTREPKTLAMWYATTQNEEPEDLEPVSATIFGAGDMEALFRGLQTGTFYRIDVSEYRDNGLAVVNPKP